MGLGIDTNKYVKMDSRIEHLGNNKYRLNVAVWASSSLVYNYYGMRVYVTMNGKKKDLIGNFVITNGKCSQEQFSYEFTVTSNQYIGAMVICSYCEDGLHNEYYSQFHNQTDEDLATYNKPTSTPGTSSALGKVWNGSSFVKAKVKVWNGSAWVDGNIKVWNGSSWIKG